MTVDEDKCLCCDSSHVDITDNEYGNEYRCQYCGIGYGEVAMNLAAEAGTEFAKEYLKYEEFKKRPKVVETTMCEGCKKPHQKNGICFKVNQYSFCFDCAEKCKRFIQQQSDLKGVFSGEKEFIDFKLEPK